jgi:hypothetical protein
VLYYALQVSRSIILFAITVSQTVSFSLSLSL